MVYRKGTLLIPTGPANHLHIVMNDPVFWRETGDERVLVVNISSIRPDCYYDQACTLQPGCHPFVTHPSYVYYKEAVIPAAVALTQKIYMGEIITRPAMNDNVFGMVRDGFDVSKHVIPKIKRFIRQHGL